MWKSESSLSQPKLHHNPSPASSNQNSLLRDLPYVQNDSVSINPASQLQGILDPSKSATNLTIKSSSHLQKHRSSLSMSSPINYHPKSHNDSEISFAQKHFFQPGFDSSISRSNLGPRSTEKSNSLMQTTTEKTDYKLPLNPIMNTSKDQQHSSYFNIPTLSTGSPASLGSQKPHVSPLSGADSTLMSSQLQENQRLAILNTIMNRRGSTKENINVSSLENSIGLGTSMASRATKTETTSQAAVRAMKALQEKLAKSEAENKQLKAQLGIENIEPQAQSQSLSQPQSGAEKSGTSGTASQKSLINDGEAFRGAPKTLDEENESLKKQLFAYRKTLDAVNLENQALKKDLLQFRKQGGGAENPDNQEVLRAYAEEILKKLDFERKRAQGLEEQLYRLYGSTSTRQEDSRLSRSHRSMSQDRIISNRDKSLTRKKRRNSSDVGDSLGMSSRIDYKIKAEALDKENANLNNTNNELILKLEKLEKRIALLKNSKEKLIKDNMEKTDLFNQVVQVNRALIAKLSENFNYADLRDVLNKMAKIENYLQRKRSPSPSAEQSLSISPKLKSHRSNSAVLLKPPVPEMEKTFNQSLANSSLGYIKKTGLVNKQESKSKLKLKISKVGNKQNKSYLGNTSKMLGKNTSLQNSYDEQSLLQEQDLNASKGRRKNLMG